MLDLENMTLTNLKALAKEHNIKNISKLKKRRFTSCFKTNIRWYNFWGWKYE